jgi:molybdopterin/thiamine biosynthesis adenylyltransferase
MRLAATNADRFRAALVGLGAEQPTIVTLPVDDANAVFVGPVSVCGFWRRVDAPPPGPTVNEVSAWVARHHADLARRAQRFARAHGQITATQAPALIGFVFPDEGPERDEVHDEWLLVLIGTGDVPALPRPVVVQEADRFTRQPQLTGLRDQRVGVVGVGALGSQIAALLARAGVGALYLVDPDVVSPGILVRHQLDYDSIGEPKVLAVARQLLKINPYLVLDAVPARYGAANAGGNPADIQQAEDQITANLAGCDLIVNATAHDATGFHLSRTADHLDRPVLHVAVSSGAWGARVLIQRHGHSGCLECLARHQQQPTADSPTVPDWPEDPEHPAVMDRGCAQATFTGPGYEITESAATAARAAVSELLAGDGYPPADYDLITMHFRDRAATRTQAIYSPLERHDACASCNA